MQVQTSAAGTVGLGEEEETLLFNYLHYKHSFICCFLLPPPSHYLKSKPTDVPACWELLWHTLRFSSCCEDVWSQEGWRRGGKPTAPCLGHVAIHERLADRRAEAISSDSCVEAITLLSDTLGGPCFIMECCLKKIVWFKLVQTLRLLLAVKGLVSPITWSILRGEMKRSQEPLNAIK